MGCCLVTYPYSICAKPVQIRTCGPWVRVLAGAGRDDLKSTHGLPVSITNPYAMAHDIKCPEIPLNILNIILPKKNLSVLDLLNFSLPGIARESSSLSQQIFFFFNREFNHYGSRKNSTTTHTTAIYSEISTACHTTLKCPIRNLPNTSQV